MLMIIYYKKIRYSKTEIKQLKEEIQPISIAKNFNKSDSYKRNETNYRLKKVPETNYYKWSVKRSFLCYTFY